MTGKPFIIEREPSFIDDEQSWPAIKPCFNTVEQVGKDSRRDCGADQPIGLEDLDRGIAKTFIFRIEKPAIRPPKAIRLQSLLQRI